MCTISDLGSTTRRLVAAVATVAMLSAGALAESKVEEPAGYRMEEFRAPVPATLAGAQVVGTDEAEALWRGGEVIFVDVLPRAPKPELPEGTIWHEPPHADIPGSVWLADVGYGSLSETMERWYRESLHRLTEGDDSHPLVFYCKAECWMSWNAAKRAVEWGYANVSWYPGGVDEWEAVDLPLEQRTPEPRPNEPTGN